MKEENLDDRLSRFLIAFDELRARLAPSKYPNLEITDEGCLWFNIDISIGIVEIICIPFGFKGFKAPSLIVSFPRKAKAVGLNFLNKLRQTAINSNGALFAGTAPANETLKAYQENIQPPLAVARELDEIIEMKRKRIFFNYLGIVLDISGKKISEVEELIKRILFDIEGSSEKMRNS